MFTGIITHQGKVLRIGHRAKLVTVAVQRPTHFPARADDSVSVNGICTTVVAAAPRQLRFEYMPETQAKTTVPSWQVGDRLNLELPLRYGQCLGGHFVTGHVDAVGTVRSLRRVGVSQVVTFQVPRRWARLLVAKGSVALDGVSLTVVRVWRDGRFSVSLMPFTLRRTTLGSLRKGCRVNVEFDLVAKYVTYCT